MQTKEIFNKMKESVILGETEKVLEYVKEALSRGLNPKEALENGLIAGIKEMSDRWAREEVFLTQIFFSAEAFKKGSDILEEEIKKTGETRESLGKIIIGTVQGDIHDIGKNIVGTYLLASGFDVYDLGVDVSTETFIEKTKELKPDVIGLSALLSFTLPMQKKVIDALKEAGFRDNIKVIIGGSATTAEWTKEIGADDFALDAVEALEKINKLLGL